MQIFQGIADESVEAVQLTLSEYKDIDVTKGVDDRNKSSPLFYAVHQAKLKEDDAWCLSIVRALLDRKANPSQPGDGTKSSTQYAAQADLPALTEMLLQATTDINVDDLDEDWPNGGKLLMHVFLGAMGLPWKAYQRPEILAVLMKHKAAALVPNVDQKQQVAALKVSCCLLESGRLMLAVVCRPLPKICPLVGRLTWIRYVPACTGCVDMLMRGEGIETLVLH